MEYVRNVIHFSADLRVELRSADLRVELRSADLRIELCSANLRVEFRSADLSGPDELQGQTWTLSDKLSRLECVQEA